METSGALLGSIACSEPGCEATDEVRVGQVVWVGSVPIGAVTEETDPNDLFQMHDWLVAGDASKCPIHRPHFPHELTGPTGGA